MDKLINNIQSVINKEIEIIKKDIVYPFQKKTNNYINNTTYEQRCSESFRILCKYPQHVPIIVTYIKFESCNVKNKFLISKHATLGELIYSIRKQLKLNPSEAIFIYFDNILMANNQNIGEIYNNYLSKKSPNNDKFLYAIVSKESTFG